MVIVVRDTLTAVLSAFLRLRLMSWRWFAALGFSAAQHHEPKYDVNQGSVSRTNYTYKAASLPQEAHMVTCCSMYWKKQCRSWQKYIPALRPFAIDSQLTNKIQRCFWQQLAVQLLHAWPEIWESAIKCCRALMEEWVCTLHYSAAGMRSLVSSRKWLVVRLLSKAGFQLVTDIQSFVLCCTCGWAILSWLNVVRF